MEYILTECSTPGCKLIYTLTQLLLKDCKIKVPSLLYSILLGALAVSLKGKEQKMRTGTDHLLCILLMEMTYLIWVLCCECGISRENNPEKYHSEQEITSQWLKRLNARLAMDQVLMRKSLGCNVTKEKLVYKMWQGTLQDEEDLPDKWIGMLGVLVGKQATWHSAGIGQPLWIPEAMQSHTMGNACMHNAFPLAQC